MTTKLTRAQIALCSTESDLRTLYYSIPANKNKPLYMYYTFAGKILKARANKINKPFKQRSW